MDENKYEKSPVSNMNEIKSAYNYAVEHNIKYYRTVSKTGIFYGWDPNTNHHVRAQNGQEWFVNPEYKEPAEEVEPEEEIIEGEIEPTEEETPAESAEQKPEENVEELRKEIEKLRRESAIIADNCRQVTMERDDLKREYEEYKKSVEAVRAFFRG